MLLRDEDIASVLAWIGTPTWAESRDHLRTYATRLVSGTSAVVLDELRLTEPEPGVAHAESWAASSAFLTDHADELLTDDAEAVLSRMLVDGDPVPLVHQALLALARGSAIEVAYGYVMDRQALFDRVQTDLRDGAGRALAHLGILEQVVFGEALVGVVHRLVAVMLEEGSDDVPDWLAELAAAADAADRNRLAAELVALQRRRPDRAGVLAALLPPLLAP